MPQNTQPGAKRALISLFVALAAWSRGGAARGDAPVPTLRITGAVSAPRAWTARQMETALASQVQTIHYALHGQMHTARAVPLLALVNQAQPRFNPHIKNHQIQFVVEVLGRDSYAADFSLAELLPDLGHRAVWLALDEDGKALGAGGPAEIVSPDDAKPARWVHGVAEVRVLDTAQP